jgi:hypothetical protein
MNPKIDLKKEVEELIKEQAKELEWTIEIEPIRDVEHLNTILKHMYNDHAKGRAKNGSP